MHKYSTLHWACWLAGLLFWLAMMVASALAGAILYEVAPLLGWAMFMVMIGCIALACYCGGEMERC